MNNESVTVKEFLSKVNSSLKDADTKEMLESAYYEDDELHYELIYKVNTGNDIITDDTIIARIEKSMPFRG